MKDTSDSNSKTHAPAELEHRPSESGSASPKSVLAGRAADSGKGTDDLIELRLLRGVDIARIR
jgi:hypothetical protein